jgi:hypothetical protein
MVRSGRGPFRPARPRRARAMHEFSPEILRNPARNRRAGLMRQFRSGQLVSVYAARARGGGVEARQQPALWLSTQYCFKLYGHMLQQQQQLERYRPLDLTPQRNLRAGPSATREPGGDKLNSPPPRSAQLLHSSAAFPTLAHKFML